LCGPSAPFRLTVRWMSPQLLAGATAVAVRDALAA
jgi:hypothetical protein